MNNKINNYDVHCTPGPQTMYSFEDSISNSIPVHMGGENELLPPKKNSLPALSPSFGNQSYPPSSP